MKLRLKNYKIIISNQFKKSKNSNPNLNSFNTFKDSNKFLIWFQDLYK